jgi:Na+(H+)/acetate symporter ActP
MKNFLFVLLGITLSVCHVHSKENQDKSNNTSTISKVARTLGRTARGTVFLALSGTFGLATLLTTSIGLPYVFSEELMHDLASGPSFEYELQRKIPVMVNCIRTAVVLADLVFMFATWKFGKACANS